MGAAIGPVEPGAILCRVFLKCTRGIVRVRCGAVGFVDVACVTGSPFELGHGRVAGSWGVVLLDGAAANFLMARMIDVSRRLRSARGRCSVLLKSSCVTWWMCSVGVSTGRAQCEGYN